MKHRSFLLLLLSLVLGTAYAEGVRDTLKCQRFLVTENYRPYLPVRVSPTHIVPQLRPIGGRSLEADINAELRVNANFAKQRELSDFWIVTHANPVFEEKIVHRWNGERPLSFKMALASASFPLSHNGFLQNIDLLQYSQGGEIKGLKDFSFENKVVHLAGGFMNLCEYKTLRTLLAHLEKTKERVAKIVVHGDLSYGGQTDLSFAQCYLKTRSYEERVLNINNLFGTVKAIFSDSNHEHKLVMDAAYDGGVVFSFYYRNQDRTQLILVEYLNF